MKPYALIKTYKYPLSITLALAGLFIFFQNCGRGGATRVSSTSASTSNELVLTPAAATVAPSGTIQLTASGGTPPYEYSTVVGSGSITPYGLVSAPSATGLTEYKVKDAKGDVAYSSITVAGSGSGTLKLSAQPTVPVYGQLLFAPSGGKPNYTFQLLATPAGGTLSTYGFYTAPGATGTVQVQVTDAAGARATATATVVGTGGGSTEVEPTSTGAYKFVNPGTNGTYDTSTWKISNLTDGVASTCYSSVRYATAYPSPPPYVLVHLAEASNNITGKTYSVTGIKIRDRVKGTSRYGWPRLYTIQVLNPDNSGYTTVGTFSQSPDFDGVARIKFPRAHVTNEIVIIGNTLTTDDVSTNYYLQFCEVMP